MNHRGKNGRNHEYQDSNDSASTPDTKRLRAPGEIFLKPDSTVKCFDSSIYYFVLILRKLRYVFSKG